MAFRTRLFTCGFLAIMPGCNQDKVRQLEKESREFAAKLDTAAKVEMLGSQEKCADQASVISNKRPGAKNRSPGTPTITSTCWTSALLKSKTVVAEEKAVRAMHTPGGSTGRDRLPLPRRCRSSGNQQGPGTVP